mmetsp:Transcript_85/g.174  ORF Transcript_85/g.174 Transcript_85/m.174 type:complete len:235 (-) Transcript_85:85-789(-)|eukprot:CAMPEP_0168738598 /NCGR_PEP_ID=MMETSP0724-20121128/11017_1 /TAXON_ID=265536 /ORGANISM="Amphiprora sp., Strain CCMP467" /LENGTH=234 /DNA_ID=CAMNT_0008785949 /DNA_START=14 /DNA_END=718 /DNA_ORIENTATION=+
MKNHGTTACFLALIGWAAKAVATTPVYFGRRVMEQHRSRNLVTCSQTVQVAEDIMGTGFDCNSVTSSHDCTVVCQGETACCGDVCGANEQTMDFDINSGILVAKEETSCFAYSSGENLAGKERCTNMEYCGGEFCGCETFLGPSKCNSCELCQVEASGNDISLTVTDCKNVEGGDYFSRECSEVNNVDKIDNLLQSLDCDETSALVKRSAVVDVPTVSSMVETVMVALMAFLLL